MDATELMRRLSRILGAFMIAVIVLTTDQAQAIGQMSYATKFGEEPPALTEAYAARDLATYDRYEVLEFDSQRLKAEPELYRREEARLHKMHEFLWQHWSQKRRAHVKTVTHWTHGRREFHVFVEPDRTGRWQLVQILHSATKHQLPMAHTYVARRVVRVDRETNKILSSTARVPLGSYTLAAVDDKGEIVSLDL